MIEQAADISVVQGLGSGSAAVCLSNFWIRHKGLQQGLEIMVLECRNKVSQRLPEFFDVLSRLWQVVGKIDFPISQKAQFVNCELKAALVFIDQAFDFKEIILLEDVNGFINVVPHFGFDLARAVTEGDCQVGLAGLLWLDLLRNHDKAGRDDLIFVLAAVANEEGLHKGGTSRGRDTQRTGHAVLGSRGTASA